MDIIEVRVAPWYLDPPMYSGFSTRNERGANNNMLRELVLGPRDKDEDDEEEAVEFSLSEPMGLELEERRGKLCVKRVLEEGQGQRSGKIRAGDVMHSIGGREVFDMASFEDALGRAKEEGKKCQVVVTRGEEDGLLQRRMSRMAEALDGDRSKLRDAEQECEDLRVEQRRRSEDLTTMKADRSRLRTELADAKAAAVRTSNDFEGRIRDLQQAHAADRARFEQRESQLEAEVAAANASAREHPDTGGLEEQLSQTRRAMDEQRRSSAATTAALRRENTAAKQRITDLEADLAHAQQQQALTAVEPLPEAPVTNGHARDDDLAQRLAKAENAARDATQRALAARADIDDARSAKNALETKLRAAVDRAAHLERENSDLRRYNKHRVVPTTTTNRFSSQDWALKRFIDQERDPDSSVSPQCQGIIVSAVRALDTAGLAVVALLRNSPAARLASLVYLVVLHLWALALVAAKAYALDLDLLDLDAPASEAGRLRGAINSA